MNIAQAAHTHGKKPAVHIAGKYNDHPREEILNRAGGIHQDFGASGDPQQDSMKIGIFK